MPESVLTFQVFLSYARPDVATVQAFYRRLQSAGIAVWMDVESIRAGEEWDLAIKRALRTSQLVIVFLSNSAVSREGYLQTEILEVLELSKRKPPGEVFLIPVRLDDCPIHPRLEHFHCVSLLDSDAWVRLFYQVLECHRRYQMSQRRVTAGQKIGLRARWIRGSGGT